MQFFSLKKIQDKRMAGLDFDSFKAQKAAGVFEEFDLNKAQTAGNPMAFL